MAEEGFFTKLTNEVLEATERISTRLEEGLSVLLDGELSKSGKDTFAPMDEEPPIDEDVYESPLPGIADGVLGDIMSSQAGPQTPMEHFHAFRSAITWSEPFILSLLVFQVVVFLACFWVSRPNRGIAPRVFLMVTIGILVRSAEYLNSLGARHWERFSTQDYFDRKGIFVGILFCAPLLVDCFIMLMFFLREASQLLVQVKKEEIRKQNKKIKEKKMGGNNKKRKTSQKQD